MGFDVYGKNPKNKKGEYFRNNVWWWHPLWDYCLNVHPQVAEKVQYGHSNDGDGLNSSDAYKLGILLRQDYHSGFAKEYEQRYIKALQKLPLEDCKVCQTTGVLKTVDFQDDNTTQKFQTCNNCEGTGKTKDFTTNYPFSAENVKQFAEFCINSGGFSIC